MTYKPQRHKTDYHFVFVHLCRIYLSAMLLCLMTFSCTGQSRSEDTEEIYSTTDSFALYYFNFDFNRSVSLCTPESIKWLRYMASNIQQEDIDKLKAQEYGASHKLGDIEYTSDTTATIRCEVFNFLKIDTLGQSGRITEHAEYKINVVKRDRKWMIKMGSPLQSERQSHD